MLFKWTYKPLPAHHLVGFPWLSLTIPCAKIKASKPSITYMLATVGGCSADSSHLWGVPGHYDVRCISKGAEGEKSFFFLRSQMPLGTFEGMEIKPGGTWCAAIESPLYPRMTYSWPRSPRHRAPLHITHKDDRKCFWSVMENYNIIISFDCLIY